MVTTDVVERHGAVDRECGAALMAVLLLTVLFVALCTAVALIADVEVNIAANHRDGVVVAHQAEAAVAFAVQELALLGDWTPALSGGLSSRLAGRLHLPAAAGGTIVDGPGVTMALQQATYRGDPYAADTPRWRLFGYGVPGEDLPFDGLSEQVFVLIWVSDDVAEVDGDPRVDANDVVVVRARAIGLRHSQCDVQAVVARVAPGVVRRVSWRIIR